MDITNEVRETARRLFGDFTTVETLEASESGCLPQALWDAFNESGFALVLVPEELGGIGAELRAAGAILNAAGEYAVPGPLLESILGNELLARIGCTPSTEPLALALAFAREPVSDGQSVFLRNVPWVQSVTQVVVAGRMKGGVGLAVVPVEQLEVSREIRDVSGEQLVRFALPADIVWEPLPGLDFETCLARAGLLRGSQMLGAMRWCLERTTAYTLERKQFGRPIAKFQAVQQMMAELAASVIAADAMLEAAIADSASLVKVAAARSRLGDAADIVFSHAHQVHGAIGFSYEYDLHFRTRRLMAWRDQYGTVAHWRRVLAGAFAGKKADDVWPVIAG